MTFLYIVRLAHSFANQRDFSDLFQISHVDKFLKEVYSHKQLTNPINNIKTMNSKLSLLQYCIESFQLILKTEQI